MREQHKLSHTRLYNIWRNMKQRCYNPKHTGYENYGEKGVIVCEEWRHSFTSFYKWAMRSGYTDELTIDRINSDGSYEPSNCRWLTLEENSRRPQVGRKGNNGGGNFKPVDYNGKTQPLKDWARELDLPYKTVYKRIHTHGWSIDKALSTPVRRKAVK